MLVVLYCLLDSKTVFLVTEHQCKVNKGHWASVSSLHQPIFLLTKIHLTSGWSPPAVSSFMRWEHPAVGAGIDMHWIFLIQREPPVVLRVAFLLRCLIQAVVSHAIQLCLQEGTMCIIQVMGYLDIPWVASDPTIKTRIPHCCGNLWISLFDCRLLRSLTPPLIIQLAALQIPPLGVSNYSFAFPKCSL